MLMKPCSNNEVSKIQYRNDPVLDKEPADMYQIKPVKRKRGRQVKTVDAEDVGELGGLQPCQGWKKARRKCADAAKDDHEESANTTHKNARKVSGRSAPKNSRKQKPENVQLEASSSDTINDDIELTVEDLVSIAEEYVKADSLKLHEVETKTARYKEHRCSSLISKEGDTGGSTIKARSIKGLSDTTTKTDTAPSEFSRDAQSIKGLLDTTVKTNTAPSESSRDDSNKQQQYKPNFTVTGDVAQDMLNIFFGPLLSKCPGYEKKSKPIESLVQNANHATEKKELSCDVQSQGEHATLKKDLGRDVQRQGEHATEKKDLSCNVQRQGEPLTKKKSSLKDMVALFL
uniref:Uncharacterized protein n=1 Tax=Leersia perrieri TaxID=77586 RepID=A0A0D9XKS2_9ORYZ